MSSQSLKMELDKVAAANYENRGWRRLDSGEYVPLDSIPIPPKVQDAEYMELDFEHAKWSSFESKLKPNDLLTAMSSRNNSKRPSWSYDGSVPEFGPKKFPVKGFSSAIAGSSRSEAQSSRPFYHLGKSVIFYQSEPMETDDESYHHDQKVTSPKDNEMQSTPKEVNAKDSVLNRHSKTVPEVDTIVNIRSEYLKDIESRQESAKPLPSEPQSEKEAFKKLSEYSSEGGVAALQSECLGNIRKCRKLSKSNKANDEEIKSKTSFKTRSETDKECTLPSESLVASKGPNYPVNKCEKRPKA